MTQSGPGALHTAHVSVWQNIHDELHVTKGHVDYYNRGQHSKSGG